MLLFFHGECHLNEDKRIVEFLNHKHDKKYLKDQGYRAILRLKNFDKIGTRKASIHLQVTGSYFLL